MTNGYGIAVDGTGSAYVTGSTNADESTFPVTAGPDLTYNSGWWDAFDAFVAKVRVDGTGRDYAGYIGGNNFEEGYGIAMDADGNAYVAGLTASDAATFPVIVGPELKYVNAAGNAYVNGWTASDQSSFPVTVGPDLTFNGGVGGGGDAFVAKVGTALGCSAAVAVVKGLRAVKQRTFLDHIHLNWAPDPLASAYSICTSPGRQISTSPARRASRRRWVSPRAARRLPRPATPVPTSPPSPEGL